MKKNFRSQRRVLNKVNKKRIESRGEQCNIQLRLFIEGLNLMIG